LFAGAIFLAVIATGATLLAIHWPFTRQAVIQALEQASGRQVEIRTFVDTYFPPGCTAEGVRFLRHKHPEAQPIVTIEKLVIRASLVGLAGSPTRLSDVRVVGMHMIVPPKSAREEGASVPLNSGPGGQSLAISHIVADGAVLEFIRENPKDKPYLLKIDQLGLTDVGPGTRMSYRATLSNTEPPGTIRAEGKFGPWNPSDVGATVVSGTYTYDDIDLGFFGSIGGKGRAKGQFSGPLARIETRGSLEVAGFRVDGSDHDVQLATTFQATVDGTHGDVTLNPAVARFRHTQIEARGRIAAQGSQPGKTASFDIAVQQGRVDDLLYLFTRGQPGMSGDVAAQGKFLWPPGPRKFLEKIRMDLVFGMNQSRFTSLATQNGIDRISESAQGEDRKEQDGNPGTVLAVTHGNIGVSGGVAAISHGSFAVPGVDATLHGTYNLLNRRVDLHGTLKTRGSLSDATSGVKAVVLKAVTPLFRKEKSVRMVPFQITGAYGNAAVGIDWKKDLSRLSK
jgi:hypothetical protein